MAFRFYDSPFQGVPSTPCVFTFKQYASPVAEVPDATSTSQHSPAAISPSISVQQYTERRGNYSYTSNLLITPARRRLIDCELLPMMFRTPLLVSSQKPEQVVPDSRHVTDILDLIDSNQLINGVDDVTRRQCLERCSSGYNNEHCRTEADENDSGDVFTISVCNVAGESGSWLFDEVHHDQEDGNPSDPDDDLDDIFM